MDEVWVVAVSAPLDPLQNILDCAAVILYARKQLREETNPLTRWLAQIGELDHICEIRRELEQVFRNP